MIYLRGIFDEKVREDIKKRNSDAAATRAEQGYPVGQVGYGWKWDDSVVKTAGVRRGIVPVEGERHWVIHIKDRYLSGWNGPRIAAELNELDVPSPLHRELWQKKRAKRAAQDGRNPQWTASQVWELFAESATQRSDRLKSGELIQGKHWEQRFWEPEVLEQLEAVHRQRVAKFKTISGRRNSPTLLNGLAFCARCGTRLYMSSSSETNKYYASYKCQNGATAG
jgi:hypothetical protein